MVTSQYLSLLKLKRLKYLTEKLKSNHKTAEVGMEANGQYIRTQNDF